MPAPALRSRRLRAPGLALAGLAVVTAVLLALLPPSSAVAAEGGLCERFAAGATDGGRYTVQNNRWGTDARQCVAPSGDGFEVVAAEGQMGPGAPKSYPSIVAGCHWGRCTNGSGLPLATSRLGGARTAVSIEAAPGVWNAAYDLWLNTTPSAQGQNDDTEIMIWIDHQGFAQPIGAVVGQVDIAGTSWTIWQGQSGWDVITFVRDVGAASVDLPLAPFVAEAIERGATEEGSYLTSVQFGFEPWEGGQGLAARGFSVTTGGAVAREPTDEQGGQQDGDAVAQDQREAPAPTATPSPTSGGNQDGSAAPQRVPASAATGAPTPAPAPTAVGPTSPSGGGGDGGPALPDPPVPPTGKQRAPTGTGAGAPLVSARTGQCLEAAPGAGGQAGVVRLRGCDGGDGQGWSVRGRQLVNAASGACLAAPGAAVGAVVVTWACYEGDPSEQWQVNDAGQLVNLAASACLDTAPADERDAIRRGGGHVGLLRGRPQRAVAGQRRGPAGQPRRERLPGHRAR